MANKKINEYARTLMEEISKKFSASTNELESELITEIRSYAENLFFIPFLEDFYLYLKEQNKTINSKYYLKILLTHEDILFHRDLLGEVGSSYTHKKEEIFYLNEQEDIFIIKGTVFNILDDLNLNDAKEYILKKTLEKYPKGGPDDIVHIYDFINKHKLANIIFKEFEKKSQNNLLIKNDARNLNN